MYTNRAYVRLHKHTNPNPRNMIQLSKCYIVYVQVKKYNLLKIY